MPGKEKKKMRRGVDGASSRMVASDAKGSANKTSPTDTLRGMQTRGYRNNPHSTRFRKRRK